MDGWVGEAKGRQGALGGEKGKGNCSPECKINSNKKENRTK